MNEWYALMMLAGWVTLCLAVEEMFSKYCEAMIEVETRNRE